MEVQAKTQRQRVSPKKVALVANLIRTQTTTQALTTLRTTPKKPARMLYKLLNAAIANGVNNHAMDAEKMVVSNVIVNEGPVLKRFRPKSKGRADRILKRSTHVTLVLKEVK